jgi:hypothetical protein
MPLGGILNRKPAQRITLLFAAVLAAALFGGCMTPYQERSRTGGYEDNKLAERVYRVRFYGNGNTPRDRVFRFWLYRCAELTVQSGYDSFSILGRARQGADGSNYLPPSQIASLPGEYEATRTAGYVPTYVYVPGGGGTYTVYNANGVIRMWTGEMDTGGIEPFFRARQVIADLDSEIKGGMASTKQLGKTYDPDFVLGKAATPGASATTPTTTGSGKSTMDDLKDLLPPNPPQETK